MQVLARNFKGVLHAQNKAGLSLISKSIGISSFPVIKNFSSINNKFTYIPYHRTFSTSTHPTLAAGCALPKIEEIQKIFPLETKDYFVHQFNCSCLAQYSYYIESNGEAIIVDPIRDTDMYLDMIRQRGARLKYILETHFHADFVSGHLELAKATGAQIVFGPQANTKLPVKVAKDGELLKLGNMNIKVFHTPGHTLESSSYVLMDTEGQPKAIFTGDFLFLGDVGRPDLVVDKGITEKDLAGLLHDSVTRLKKEYPGDLVIFPGHGAGSACGKNISQGACDTLSNQIKTNYALNDNLTRQEFIEIVTSNLPTPPQYFFFDLMLNRQGHEDLQSALKKSLVALKPEHFISKIKSDHNVKVIDTREFPESRKSFLKGSYLISLSMQFAIWVANLFKPEDKILLIADKGKEREAIVRMARVGYDNVIGYLDGKVEDLSGLAELTCLSAVSPSDVKSVVVDYNKERKFEALDVREVSEWKSCGVLPNAHLIALSQFEKGLPEFKEKVDKERKVGVYCKTGGRATVAASILKKYDYKDVFVLGGYMTMKEKEVEFVSLSKNKKL